MVETPSISHDRQRRSTTNFNTILAVGLAAAALVVFVVVIAMGGALQAGLAPWPGIGIAVLAVTAFALPRERRSLVVAGLLRRAVSSASYMA